MDWQVSIVLLSEEKRNLCEGEEDMAGCLREVEEAKLRNEPLEGNSTQQSWNSESHFLQYRLE